MEFRPIKFKACCKALNKRILVAASDLACIFFTIQTILLEQCEQVRLTNCIMTWKKNAHFNFLEETSWKFYNAAPHCLYNMGVMGPCKKFNYSSVPINPATTIKHTFYVLICPFKCTEFNANGIISCSAGMPPKYQRKTKNMLAFNFQVHEFIRIDF